MIPENFDPSTFDPREATEEVCWAALPLVTGSIKAGTLFTLGNFAYQREDYGQASVLADQAADVWKSQGNDSEAGSCRMSSGRALLRSEDYDEAKERFTEASKIFAENGDEAEQSHALLALGEIANIQDETELAVSYFEQAFSLASAIGEQQIMQYALRELGVVKAQQSEHQQAIDFYSQAYQIATDLHSSREAASLKDDIATSLIELEEYESAHHELAIARDLSILMQDDWPTTQRGLMMSLCLRRLNRDDEAIEIAHQVKEIAINGRNPMAAALADAEIGYAMMSSGLYREAFSYLHSARNVLDLTGKTKDAIMVDLAAAQCSVELGDMFDAEMRLNRATSTAMKFNKNQEGEEIDFESPTSVFYQVATLLRAKLALIQTDANDESSIEMQFRDLLSFSTKDVKTYNVETMHSIFATQIQVLTQPIFPKPHSKWATVLEERIQDLLRWDGIASDFVTQGYLYFHLARLQDETTTQNDLLVKAFTYFAITQNSEGSDAIATWLESKPRLD